MEGYFLTALYQKLKTTWKGLVPVTAQALISAANLWLANMDAGKLNFSVFIDLKKAFNTVDHNILLRKLYCYGVNGNALQLLKSYLTDRTQRCYAVSYTHLTLPTKRIV